MPHNRPEVHEVYFEIYTKYSGVYDEEQKKVSGMFDKCFETYTRYLGKFEKMLTKILWSFELRVHRNILF